MKAHSTTRGEKTSDVATTNQILRESDFGAIDDLVEETINKAAEKMAAWAMQFIKLFYTSEHMISILGQEGEIVHEAVVNDLVEDGMDVIVSASGVDKLQAKREAFEMARMQLIDPLTFFKDSGMSDAKGRTERLMTFLTSPELYMQKFVLDRTTEEMAAMLNQQAPQQAQPQQAQPQAGQEMTAPPAGGGGNGINTTSNSMLQNYGGGSVSRNTKPF